MTAARLQDCIGIRLRRGLDLVRNPLRAPQLSCRIAAYLQPEMPHMMANCFRILARHRLRGVHRKHKMKRTLWLQCKATNLAAMSDTSWGCQSVEDKRCTSDAGLSFVEMRYRKYRPDVVCLRVTSCEQSPWNVWNPIVDAKKNIFIFFFPHFHPLDGRLSPHSAPLTPEECTVPTWDHAVGAGSWRDN